MSLMLSACQSSRHEVEPKTRTAQEQTERPHCLAAENQIIDESRDSCECAGEEPLRRAALVWAA